VVQLVLDGASLKAVGPECAGVPGAHNDALGPGHVGGDVRDAEAALAGDVVPLRFQQLGIGQDDESVGRSGQPVPKNVDDGDSNWLADLRSRQAHTTLVGTHRVDEVLGDRQLCAGVNGLTDTFEQLVRER
jgi:hypothetical protein